MSGNTFGQQFTVTTFGASHGAALGAIVDGCPPGMELSEEDVQPDIDRRRTGQSKYTSQRQEPDRIEILSGTFEGKTTGTPIGLVIHNTDQRSKDYDNIKAKFRPAHADFTYLRKYGIRDHRGGGRASARETVMRVAAGAIAKKYLSVHEGVQVRAYLSGIGDIVPEFKSWDAVHDNPFFCPNVEDVDVITEFMDQLLDEGNSIGAEITVVARGVPAGWGEPVFAKLDAELAGALMSINAVKAVGIGDGFAVVGQRGTEHRDEISRDGFASNHAGGILGGISSGQPIVATIALKPTSSLTKPGKTLDLEGNETEVITKGRHDPCVGIRAAPIAEAMVALVLMDHLLRHRGQIGEVGL